MQKKRMSVLMNKWAPIVKIESLFRNLQTYWRVKRSSDPLEER